MLAEQQRATIDQVKAGQAVANQQLWEHMSQLMAVRPANEKTPQGTTTAPSNPNSALRIPKMIKEDDPEAFINAFE